MHTFESYIKHVVAQPSMYYNKISSTIVLLRVLKFIVQNYIYKYIYLVNISVDSSQPKVTHLIYQIRNNVNF